MDREAKYKGPQNDMYLDTKKELAKALSKNGQVKDAKKIAKEIKQ